MGSNFSALLFSRRYQIGRCLAFGGSKADEDFKMTVGSDLVDGFGHEGIDGAW